MSDNDILMFGQDARAKLARGMDILARAVGATLGPKGRNVVLDRPMSQRPRVTKDGVTVARDVRAKDEYENMGVQIGQQAAEQQNQQAGDGTTTVTVLANAIVKEGMKAVAAEINPMDLRRGIELAANAVSQAVLDMAMPVEVTPEGRDRLYQVAMISSNGDVQISENIADAMVEVGRHGVLCVEEWPQPNIGREIVPGFQFDRGYMSPHFINNDTRYICELQNPFILIYDGKIAHLSKIAPLLEQIIRTQKGLLIIAEAVEDEVLNTLIYNKIKGNFPFCAVRTPAFGKMKDDLLEDLAAVTGAVVISPRSGNVNLETVEIKHLGRADRVIVEQNQTIVIGGQGMPGEREKRTAALEQQLSAATDPTDRKNLEIRLGSIAGAIGVIRVGAATEVEIKERKDRVDDAVHAVRAAVRAGIVPGGGMAMLRAGINSRVFLADVPDCDINTLKSQIIIRVDNDAQKQGANILRRALSAPIRTIFDNAGAQTEVIMPELYHLENDPWKGINVRTMDNCNLLEAGVIDPAYVVAQAIRNAASVAGLLITTEAVIRHEEVKRAP